MRIDELTLMKLNLKLASKIPPLFYQRVRMCKKEKGIARHRSVQESTSCRKQRSTLFGKSARVPKLFKWKRIVPGRALIITVQAIKERQAQLGERVVALGLWLTYVNHEPFYYCGS